MRTLIRISIVAIFVFAFSALLFAADTGADVFKTKCTACHGADGKGDTLMGKKLNAKDMTSADVQKLSDTDLSGFISNGKDKMPSYKEKLTADQIQDLVKYIRTFKK